MHTNNGGDRPDRGQSRQGIGQIGDRLDREQRRQIRYGIDQIGDRLGIAQSKQEIDKTGDRVE